MFWLSLLFGWGGVKTMALAQAFSVPNVPPSCYQCGINGDCKFQKEDLKVSVLALATAGSSNLGLYRISIGSHLWRSETHSRRWRSNAVDTRIVQNAPSRTTVEIPVTCYQVTFSNLSLSTTACVCMY